MLANNYYNFTLSALLFLSLSLVSSCKKILEEKSTKELSLINDVGDLKALLNNTAVMNDFGPYTDYSIAGADEYSLAASTYENADISVRQIYTWASDAAGGIDNWGEIFKMIYASNIILYELGNLSDGTLSERDDIKGQALFFRAFGFYTLAQAYCRAYNSNTSTKDLGLPLRLTAGLEENLTRSTVEETYQRIIADLTEAAQLLPVRQGTVNHPGKLSCYALFSRLFLSMREYEKAKQYAQRYLEISGGLLDYNTLDVSASPGIPLENVENAFLAYGDWLIPSQGQLILVDSSLLSSYDADDLRKQIFFVYNEDSTAYFKGSYSGYGFDSYFGLATDEIYLIRAECRAREDDVDGAMEDLNGLRIMRYKTGSYIPVSAADQHEAVQLIIEERKKELIFRGTRWSDLRRLNIEGAEIKLERVISGQTYSLPPNDNRWVWLLPQNAIKLSNLEQNPR